MDNIESEIIEQPIITDEKQSVEEVREYLIDIASSLEFLVIRRWYLFNGKNINKILKGKGFHLDIAYGLNTNIFLPFVEYLYENDLWDTYAESFKAYLENSPIEFIDTNADIIYEELKKLNNAKVDIYEFGRVKVDNKALSLKIYKKYLHPEIKRKFFFRKKTKKQKAVLYAIIITAVYFAAMIALSNLQWGKYVM